MILVRWAKLAAAAVFLVITHPLSAQTRPEGNVKIISNPNASIVTLSGEYTLRGQTPYIAVHALKGYYKLEARKRGYEDFNSSYFFKPDVRKKLAIRLTRKSRPRSFFRSMFMPGWGQAYTDQRWKGLLFAGVQLGAAGYFVITHKEYLDAKDAYNKAFDAFAQSGAQDAKIYQDVEAKYKLLIDKYDNRERVLILNMSVYLYNLFDTLFFYPKYHYPKLRASVELNRQGSQPTLAFGVRASF